MKASQRLNKQVCSFKKEMCDVWQDRPRCISHSKAKTKVWNSSVHFIEKFDQILHISPLDDEGDKSFVELSFYCPNTL